MDMTKRISCRLLAGLMKSEQLYAVLDVRERGEFNDCQIVNATSLPRSQIEFRIAELIPNPTIQIVLYDEGGRRAELAAAKLAALGYSNVSILEGGLTVWKDEGSPTISGVNVPSKVFGERVYKEHRVPEITVEELKKLQDNAADLMILDTRTPEEYGRFCIPGGLNVPGGNLIHWVEALRQQTNTMVVVNCAGRTRSIIGTAALRRLGLENVRALRNGTMGWVLAGFDLELKPAKAAPIPPAPSREKGSQIALRLAEEEGIPWISSEQVRGIAKDKTNVTYMIDVRSEAEYESGHAAGALNVPGGQAVQRADDFVAVRNAKIIFMSGEVTRAVMAAYWYRQMGFPDVSVLRGGLKAWQESGLPLVSGESIREPLGIEAAQKTAVFIQPDELMQKLKNSSMTVVDVGSSVDFDAAHVSGARWISRGWIDVKLPEHVSDRARPITLTCSDGRNSTLAAQALAEIGYRSVSVLDGGLRAWMAAGEGTEKGLDSCLMEPNDVVISPSIRGNKEDMKRYLEWEVNLKH